MRHSIFDSPHGQRIAAILGKPVLTAFKRNGRWWVVVDAGGETAIEITLEEYLDRIATGAPLVDQ